MQENLLGADEVAELLGVSKKYLYQMRHHGRGPASFKRGRELRYRREDVDSFLLREQASTRRGDEL